MLVQRYQPVLLGVARRLGLSQSDAADATQQTLFELVRDLRAGGFDRTRGRLRGWALAILRNRVNDVRRLKLRGGVAGAMERDELESARLQAREAPRVLEELWDEQIERHVLTTALERLREHTRIADHTLRAFELTVLRDVPIEAAAKECGVTVDDVYVARNRVATRLREIVQELHELYRDDGP